MKRFFFLLTFLFPFILGAQCLSGTYTIGGVSPNYTTIGAAVTALTTNGVCGPVTFNIRNGVYVEQLLIDAIPGASAANNIVFQSENLDSTAVTISYTPTFSNSYVIRLNGANYVTFSKLTLTSTTGVWLPVIHILSNTNYTTIKNCILNAPTYTTPTSGKALVYFIGSNADSILILNNVMTGACNGIYFQGTAASTRIQGNIFTLQNNYGIYLQSLSGKILNNTISGSITLSSYKAISLDYVPNIQIESNTIISNQAGVYLFGPSSGSNRISNNSIVMTGGVGDGLNMNNINNISIQHNSISVGAGTGKAYYHTIGTGVMLQNNIISNATGGYVMYLNSAVGISSNNNIYYTSGTNLIYNNGISYNAILPWTIQSGNDAVSVSAPPSFLSSTNLHISSDFSMNMPTLPPSSTGLPKDRDGVTRPTSNPYPGAFEYTNTPIPNDIAVISMRMQAGNICSGFSNTSIAVIKNYGANPLSSAIINWERNTVPQTPTSWTGNLAYGDTIAVALPPFIAITGGSYNFKVWGSLPNNSTDGFAYNDTLRVNNQNTGLNGTYTIGGTSPDYASFNSAATDLVSRGVCGPVTFLVRNGVYNEQVSIGTIPFVSATNKVTFRSENNDSTLVTLIYASAQSLSNYTLSLNGASYISFEKMSIVAANSTYGIATEIKNGSSHTTIKNCRITSNTTSGNYDQGSAIFSKKSTIENFTTIEQNVIIGGVIGICLNWGTSGSGIETGGIIRNNSISGFGYAGIRVDQVSNILVEKNNVNSTNSAQFGIYFTSGNTSLTTGNISSNKIYGTLYNGLFLEVYGNASFPFLVYNNFIQAGNVPFANAFYTGITQGASSAYIDIVHNSVQVVGSSNNPTNDAAYYASTSIFGVRMLNNTFQVNGLGFAFRCSATTIGNGHVHDWNNWFTNGSAIMFLYTTSYSTLSSWTAATSLDGHSFNVNSFFQSNTDLHSHQGILKHAGSTYSGITTDIDGQLRNNPPDIGADELTLLPNDAATLPVPFNGLICSGQHPVTTILFNNGNNNLTVAQIGWKVNNINQSPVVWTGSILPGDSAIINLGNYNFTGSGSFTIKSWSSLPNNFSDAFILNDTSAIFLSGVSLSGTYTVGGFLPDFSSPAAAIAAINTRGICGPVTMKIRNGIYSGQLTLNTIVGGSSTNRVRFISETGDSSQVIINAIGTQNDNYVLNIAGVSYVTFSKITFTNTNTTYGSVLFLSGTCKYDSIYHCAFSSSTSSNPSYLIYENATGQKAHLNISGNRFETNSLAIWLTAISSDSDFVVQKNTFICAASNGEIYFAYINGLDFSQNKVVMGGVIVQAITSRLDILKNQINGMINIQYCTTNNASIINNYVSSSNYTAALSVSNSAYLRIVNNTFQNTVNVQAVSFSNNSYNIQYYNNIAVTQSANVLTGNTLQSVFDTCDYNAWYNTSGSFAFFNSVTYPSFAAWSTATGYDTHSIFANPMFISNTDYHLLITSPLLQLALPSSFVPDDLDGDIRGANPDIGADENPSFAYDASLTSFSSNTCVSANSSIIVNMLNNAAQTLTSVTIAWKVNNVLQTPLLWTGSVAPGQTLSNILVGNYPFTIGQTYQIKAWVTNPNNAADQNHSNDTISTTVTARYGGTYTVGGVSPDFATLHDATWALHLHGICSSVILNIRDGIYVDTIAIRPIPGSGPGATVTITAESGDSSRVILESKPRDQYQNIAAGPGGLFWLLDSTSNIVLTKLTLRSGLDLTSRLIAFTTNNDHIEISHCRFNGVHTNIGSTGTFIDYPNAWPFAPEIRIEYNSFIDGDGGIHIDGLGRTIIRHNVFYQQKDYAISIGASNNVRVQANTIEDLGLNPNYLGISVNMGTSNPLVTDSSIVSENIITIYAGIKGLNYGTATTIPSSYVSLVRNNAITINSNSSSAVGIDVSGDRIRVLYNTVRMRGTDCMAVFKSNVSNGTIMNNCFANYTSAGRSFDFLAVSSSIQDYNNYYSISGTLGLISGNPYTSLSAFQTATSQESHSNAADPKLVTVPFYRPTSSALQNTGTPQSLALRDIKGSVRSSLIPDMGCYEYAAVYDVTPYKINSAALNCSGPHTVQIGIRNTGNYTVTAVTVHWSINGTAQPLVYWFGSLAAGDSVTNYTVGTFNSALGTADVEVFLQTVSDGNSLNDTIRNDKTHGPMSGDYTIGGNSPDFRMLDDAFTSLETYGVCGPVRLLMRDGFFYEQPTLSNVAFTPINNLTITSESGDSSLVTLYAFLPSYFSFNRPLLRIDSTSNITIHSIGFDNGTSSDYFSSSMIQNIYSYHTHDIHITHSKFRSQFPLSTGVLLYVYSTNHFTLDSNNFTATINSIRIGGNNGDTSSYINVHDNISNGGINLEYVKNATVQDNQMTSFSIKNSGDSVFVTRNEARDYAVIDQLYGTPSSRNKIWNNFFENSLYVTDLRYGDLVYNNIGFSYYVPNIAYAFTVLSADHSAILNNNITCTYLVNTPVTNTCAPVNFTNSTMDYNNFWNGPQTSFLATEHSYGRNMNSISIDPQYVSSTDLHVQNPALGAMATPVSWVIDDYDRDVRPIATPGIGADEPASITPNLSLVWPGNANKDSIVDNNDLLPIGVHMGQSGYVRSSISNIWQGFPCYDWGTSQMNGRDLKFVDSNGDGIVTASDTTAVGLNYGQIDISPPIAHLNSATAQRAGEPLFFTSSSTTYYAGDPIDIYIGAGDIAQPINQLYGAAFKISFTTGVTNPNTTALTYPSSWVCNPSIDGLSLSKVFESQGRADGAVVRFDHNGQSGYGPFALLHFQANTNITQPTTVNFNFEDYRLIDSLGNVLSVAPQTYSITILPLLLSNTQTTVDLPINVFPNPASESLTVGFYLPQSELYTIEIFDLLGQRVLVQTQQATSSGDQQVQIPVSNLVEGNYILSIQTSTGKYVKRISVAR